MANSPFFKQVRNNLAISGAALVFFVSWLGLHQLYVAIILGNIVFLGLFALADFGDLLRLASLEARCEELMGKRVQIAEAAEAIKHDCTPSGSVVLDVQPKVFRQHQDFVGAFQIAYIADDTRKFIISYKERVRNNFFMAFVGALLLLIVFQALSQDVAANPMTDAANSIGAGEPFGEILTDVKITEGIKITTTLAAVLLNAINILRIYWFYRERNAGVVK